MGLHDEAKLDRKFVEFAKLMNIHLNHFPKHEKYGLALEIRRTAYAVYGFIVEAQKRYHKKTALSSLDVEHEKLRMLVRLAFELGYFEFKDGKRELGIRHYCRYVDDFVLFGISRDEAIACREQIIAFLAGLKLELSKSTIAPVSRGVNFVGYRTWTSKRFIRRHSLYTFRSALKRGRMDSAVSVLGHARRTHSLQHMLRHLKEHHHAYTHQLPQAYRRPGHPRAAAA